MLRLQGLGRNIQIGFRCALTSVFICLIYTILHIPVSHVFFVAVTPFFPDCIITKLLDGKIKI